MLQMYFFCRNNIDLKYTSSSVIQQVEVYLKHTWSIFEVRFKYTWSMLPMYFGSILPVYLKYNESILHFSKGFSVFNLHTQRCGVG